MMAMTGEKTGFDVREFLFRHRDHVPITFAVAGVVEMWSFHPDAAAGNPGLARGFTVVGAAAIALGELLRIWAVGYSGRTTRAKSLKAPALATGGPYAVVQPDLRRELPAWATCCSPALPGCFLPNPMLFGSGPAGEPGEAGVSWQRKALRGEKWTLANMVACGIGLTLVMSWLRTGHIPFFAS